MNKHQLFALLEKQPPLKMLELLKDSYDKRSAEQRNKVFGKLVVNPIPIRIMAKKLTKEVRQFYEDSLEGRYYAPFDINSKNFTHIPEETEEWFDRITAFFRRMRRYSRNLQTIRKYHQP